jgi:hypothetical protein
MNKTIVILFFLFPFLASAQNDLLVLVNKGMQVKTFTPGLELNMQTIYNQWFDGTITDMRHDSVFVNGMPFHYKEIAAIRISHVNFGNTVLADGMMVAGGGIFVLGAVNGLNRGDSSNQWYTGSGLVTGAALLVVGYLLTRTRAKTYKIGNKYKLDYLALGPGGPTHSLNAAPNAN